MLMNSVDVGGPAQPLVLQVRQGQEVTAGEERVPDVGHGPLDTWFVLRFVGPRRVNQGAVERRQLTIGTVDLRVIQIRADHSGLEVVADQPGRDTPKELERRHMRGIPGCLVHSQDRLDEQCS
jgi:hypothetical protein